MNDWRRIHRAYLDALTGLVATLTDADLARPVPATPAWTVHQVLAHLAGAPADLVAGRTDGAPGPEWSARHVAEREQRTAAELLAEIEAHADALAASVADDPRPAAVWDGIVHLCDLHEALGLPPPDDHLWKPITHEVAPLLLSSVPARVSVGAATYGAGGPHVAISDYEFFRTAFSRRSRRQVLDWAGDALPLGSVEGLGIFGVRDDDQPVPAAPVPD